MNIAYCDFLADRIRKNGVYQDDLIPQGVFDSPQGLEEGFSVDKKYYFSRADLANFFHAGRAYGLAKSQGEKNRWDNGFCQSIGGYPEGSIIRNENGARMISRKANNFATMPSDGKPDANWGSVLPRQGFLEYRFNDDNHVWNTTSNTLTFEAPIFTTSTVIVIPFSPQKYGWAKNTEGGLLSMDYFYWPRYVTSRSWQWHDKFALDGEGEFSMKISQFSDIYDNDEHGDEYVEMLHSYEAPNGGRVRVPPKTIPVKVGNTYYIYLEYKNGRCQRGTDSGGNYYRYDGSSLNWRYVFRDLRQPSL